LADEISPFIQRQEYEDEEEEEALQAKQTGQSETKLTSEIENHIFRTKGMGNSLPNSTRAFFESRFGYDFSNVKIHHDAESARLARQLNAEAFTYGRDIYFGAGRYNPNTFSGKRLLAHELTHVVQQGEEVLKRIQMKKTITIKRDINIKNSNCCVPNQNSCCTLGKASIDEQDVGYTLELPDCKNKRNISRIPSGRYKTREELKHSKFSYCLRLDNVPGRTGILIHAGNEPKDTKGCILPGQTRETKTCWISKSKDALENYKKIINSDPDIETVIQPKFKNEDVKNIRFPIVQRHGKHSFLVTPLQKYLHTLQHAGKTQAQWENGLIRNATFLSFPIKRGIHSELKTRLNLAENYLRKLYHRLSDTQIIKKIGIYSIKGLRKPRTAVSGSKISYHAFGLAIDINYRGNPFIARSQIVAQIIKRATLLILKKEINIRKSPPSRYTIPQLVGHYKKASDALKRYFNFRNNPGALTNHISKLSPGLKSILIRRGLPTNTAGWLKIIKADYKNPALKKEFVKRDPALGFIDLKEELVVALVRKAGLRWGGQYRNGKDFMHFDWRNGTIKNAYRV